MIPLLRLLQCHRTAELPQFPISCLEKQTQPLLAEGSSSSKALSELLAAHGNNLPNMFEAYPLVFIIGRLSSANWVASKRHIPDIIFSSTQQQVTTLASAHLGLWIPLRAAYAHSLTGSCRQVLSFSLFRSLVQFDWGFAVSAEPPQAPRAAWSASIAPDAIRYFAYPCSTLDTLSVSQKALRREGSFQVTRSPLDLPVRRVGLGLHLGNVQRLHVNNHLSIVREVLQRPLDHVLYELCNCRNIKRIRNESDLRGPHVNVTTVSYFDILKHIHHCLPNGLPREFTKVLWEWWGSDDNKNVNVLSLEDGKKFRWWSRFF
eukprot:PhM_4_TR18075/c2_g5_i1/m.66361